MEFENQYLSYEDYKLLGGTLNMTPFNLLELEARKNIDKYTFGRLIDLEEQKEEVKVCCYKLINLLDKYNSYATREIGVTSESIDGYSISYGSSSDATATEDVKKSEVKGIIETYLAECALEDGTPYLYKGV